MWKHLQNNVPDVAATPQASDSHDHALRRLETARHEHDHKEK